LAIFLSERFTGFELVTYVVPPERRHNINQISSHQIDLKTPLQLGRQTTPANEGNALASSAAVIAMGYPSGNCQWVLKT
jgi:hypothetical protein